jgi:Zn-dependent alcohol dehydrogenase
MKVRAAVLDRPRNPFTLETLDLADPRADEILVRIRAVGVCHSDWHLVTGDTPHPMPVVAGHEGAGMVEAVGDNVSHLKPGDLVALSWAPSCGVCYYCLHARPSLCQAYHDRIWAGTLLDGTTRLSRQGQPVHHYCSLAAFADYAVVPSASCIPMPTAVPLTVAALIGCAVTTGVGAVLTSAHVSAGSSVAIFGAGGVGLSMVLGARAVGANPIVVVDTSEVKLKQADALGATHGVLAGPFAVDEIRELTSGRGADYVFEAVGIPAVQEACVAAARPGGTIVFAGLSPVGSATNVAAAVLTREEKTIMGSYYGSSDPARDFPRFADMYAAGQLDLDRLIRRTYRLDEINQAYGDLLAGQPGRGVVVFD